MLAQQLVAVEMEIADQGHAHPGAIEAFADRGDGGCRFAGIDRHTHELGSGARERLYLPHRRFDVGGVGIGHRLHHDGGAAPDADACDAHLD
jgi:hypothetical protein